MCGRNINLVIVEFMKTRFSSAHILVCVALMAQILQPEMNFNTVSHQSNENRILTGNRVTRHNIDRTRQD